MWWRFTTLEVRGISLAEKYDLTNRLAKVVDELEISFVDMFIAPEEISGLDNSPALMIDNMGPYSGVWTSTFVREVEEFGGKHCHNAMRLAQLATLGYDFYVLAGAFVASTESSRGATSANTKDDALGASRCDGCIMLQGKHEEIMASILDEERNRVAKAAVVWSEL